MKSMQEPEISKLFGEVLQQARARAGISQEELAYRAGIDRTFVSRLERGIRQPTITTLIGLGVALGVPSATLVNEVEEQCLDFLRVKSRDASR